MFRLRASEELFVVKDSDVVGSQLIGVVAIPVERVHSGMKVEGTFPILGSNGKLCKPGAVLSLSIQYVPIEKLTFYDNGVGSDPDHQGVPGTYFPVRKCGKVTLYQGAHVPDGCLPNFKLDDGFKYEHGNCWQDIFDAISEARYLIYTAGWSLYPKVRLLQNNNGSSDSTLGDLLKTKSQEGVKVLLLVGNDPTSIKGYKREKSTRAFANSMMARNLTHYSESSVQDHGSPRSRNPSRKSQSRTERSPTRHRKSHRGSSPPSEKYSILPKSPKHARSPSARSPFLQTKRLRRAEAGGVPEREQERINGRGIGRSLQEGGSEGDVGSDRTEKFSGRNDTDGNTSRSRHGTSPSDRNPRSRHRHSPQHAGDTRDEERVTEGRNRNHSRGNDRSMHRENETVRTERMTAKDNTGHMSARSRHDTSPSDQHRRSRHRYYSPQHACDTRHGEKVIEGRERNHSRGNHRSMHMENETERMERMTARESTSHRSSRSRHNTSPSDRHRSRHRSHSPQHTGDTRDKEKVIEGRERNHSRGNYRSMRWENDTERMERMTAKESSGHRSSRSRHGSSPSDRHRSSRHRYHSPHHAGDTRDKEKVIEDCQRNYRRENDRIMHREKHSDRKYETERMETRTAKDSSGHRSARRHTQSTSPLNGHHKNRHRTHSSQQVADIRARNEAPQSREAKDGIEKNDSVAMMSAAEEVLEAQKKQNPSFELSGKFAMETNRFRGDSYKKNLLSSSNYDGDEDYDNERTRGICRLNLAPRKKKLLVFDLNGLLVYRVFCFNKSGIPRDRTPDGKCGNHLVFKRAFAEEFMLFCLERFEVGIWTSALEKNVDGVLDCVMEKLRSRLIFVWDQHQCTDSGFKSLETKMKPLFFKELKRVWDHFEGKFSASDTLLIDDQPYKALLNPPYTGIFLDPYIPDNGTDNALDPKKELGKYLAGLAFADDVQHFVKDNPFGQPAISSEHPDWNFYSHVLRKLGKDLLC